ncbi:MAG: dihydroorotase [Candidatus Altimarinota bacterium]
MHLRDINSDNLESLNDQISEHGLILKNATVVSHQRSQVTNLGVNSDGYLAKFNQIDFSSKSTVIDVKGLHILPGAIDTHVHSRDGEQSYKEDWETISQAATAGGVTTAFGMPNTKPLTDSAALLQNRFNLAAKSLINYSEFIGSLGENDEEILNDWVQQSASGIKLYLNQTTGGFTITVEKALQLAARLANKNLRLKFVLHAEGDTLKQIAEPLLKMGHRVHVAHISLAEEVDLVHQLQKKGYPITAEVTPHHLFISIEEMREKVRTDICELCEMKPPLSPKTDLPRLFQGLKDGSIISLATDHAPHTKEEKQIALAENKIVYGVPGVQEMLPLALTHLPPQNFTLQEIVALTSTNPARHFNLANRGQITNNSWADLAIVDLHKTYQLGDQNHPIFSRCGWTLYQDWPVKGEILATLVNGHFAFANQQHSQKAYSTSVEFKR